jgi:hypothetical protein
MRLETLMSVWNSFWANLHFRSRTIPMIKATYSSLVLTKVVTDPFTAGASWRNPSIRGGKASQVIGKI